VNTRSRDVSIHHLDVWLALVVVCSRSVWTQRRPQGDVGRFRLL